MSRLHIIHDLSPSRLWLFASVHGNRELLRTHGIELGPLGSWACELAPSHLAFWSMKSDKSAVPTYISKMLNELIGQLESGYDVLLLSGVPSILAHQSFRRLCQQHSALARHNVRILFILGRPACVLEQRYRDALSLLPEKLGLALVKSYGALPALVRDARQAWGKNNVRLLANVSASPVAQQQNDVAQGLFDFLDCPNYRPLRRLPRHPLCLGSHAARRLSRAMEVRENAWPYLDEGLFMDSLSIMDCQWGTEPVSPKKMRDILIQGAANDLRELEEMLALEPGALDCPDWLAEQPEVKFAAPLPDERLQSFAAALPSQVREPLRQRFANDARLLTPDQEALSQALASLTPADAMVISEPIPPVEMAVLTMTYNHEAYIAQCMGSVLAQQTSFPVRHIVLDHHSADATPSVVAAYAARHPSIHPVLLSQRVPSENVMGLFLRCRTKYVALCDGDDYFTDPLKLQKQVDFLESHPHCALCFHPVAVVYENDDNPPGIYPPFSMLPRGVHEEYYLSDLFRGNMIQTNSAVYRWRFQEGMPGWFRPDLCPGDWYWHLLHAEMGKIGFLPEVMSAYRRHKKALFATASVSSMEHRRVHGLAELAVYWAVNEHFRNRYFRSLTMLANGVFADFLKIYAEEGDQTLLDQASNAFPKFAQCFLSELKVVNK